MSRELDPDALFREIDSKQEQETKSIGYMLDERQERRMKHDYKALAKELIHEYSKFENSVIKTKLGIKSITPFYITKIEKAINDEGYDLIKIGTGYYEIKINEETKEVVEFIDKKFIDKQKKERVENVEVVKAEVETETVEEVVESEEFMMQEGQVIDPVFLLLKNAIKEPEKLIEMNDFFEAHGMGLAFVIKDVELVEVEVKKSEPAGVIISNPIESAGEIIKHEPVAIFADSFQIKKKTSFMERFVSGEKKTITCFKCQTCGNISYLKIGYGDIIKCSRCEEEIDTRKLDLYHTHYSCPNCEARPQILTDIEVKEVSCVECRGPIDLSDPDKHGTRYNISKGGKR